MPPGQEYNLCILSGRGGSGSNGTGGSITFTGVASYSDFIEKNAAAGDVNATHGLTGDVLNVGNATLRSNVQNYTKLTFVASRDTLQIRYNATSQYAVQALAIEQIQAIPQPASITFGLLALAGFGMRRRR